MRINPVGETHAHQLADLSTGTSRHFTAGMYGRRHERALVWINGTWSFGAIIGVARTVYGERGEEQAIDRRW